VLPLLESSPVPRKFLKSSRHGTRAYLEGTLTRRTFSLRAANQPMNDGRLRTCSLSA
jgi:hypothetical protein